MRRFPAALAALALTGCGDPNDAKALRNLGEECVGCHTRGRKAGQWPFTAGGTVYRTADDDPIPGLAGVRVTLVDGRGKVVGVTTNRAGNFWVTEPLAFPVAVELQREGSDRKVTVRAGPCAAGDCDACHARPGKHGAPGRLYAPL